jgi:hypothetical protein
MQKVGVWIAFVGVLASAGGAVIAAPQQDGQAGAKPQTPKEDNKAQTPKPGKDRWLVKTASDPDAEKVNKKAQETTIEKLLALARPKDFPLDGSNAAYQQKRIAPVETSVYAVEADVVECRLMPDGDYRVVIQGASGKPLVLEMPDPDPAFVDPKSPFAYSIKAAREQFKARFTPTTTTQKIQGHVRITGIGFFGRTYGKNKPDGNLLQLHPVLDVDWMDKPTEEFTKAAEKAKEKGKDK